MNAEELNRLSHLIETKGWSVYDGKLRGRGHTIEDVLVKFLSQMTGPQRELTLELLSEYYINKEYTDAAIDLLEALRGQTLDTIKIAPVKVKDAAKIKSGDALVYEMDAAQDMIPGDFLFSDDPFSQKFWVGAEKIVLVDDFVGSGDQFLEMIDSMRESGISVNIDFLATIVIQESGRSKIEDAGIPVVSLFTRPKALENLAVTTQRDIADLHDIYLSIEGNTNCNPFYSLGYMASEATVTMKKTPDNTLPIFWHDGDTGWLTPFPRNSK